MFFDFAPRRAFDFEKKTFTRRITNNSLLHVTKQFLLYLNSLDWSSAFDFRIWFAKTLIAFDFDEKLTQRVAQVICNITCQKTFFPCTLRLIRCFQFQGMIWKTEECCVSKKYCIKNMAVIIPILILFRFCLLCWLKNHLFCVLSRL